jgi:transposase
MRGKKKVYTNEFKFDAVRLVLEEGLTKAETSRRLGVNQNSLGKWVKAYEGNRENAFPGKGRQTAEKEEITRLREENRQLKMEREILKKAAAFFAKETN